MLRWLVFIGRMLLLFLLRVLALLPAIAALQNVTLDDAHPMIKYSTGWAGDSSHLDDLDYGGSLARNGNDGDWASLTFTGVAVYFMAPRWPYEVTMRLTLDNQDSDLVNLTDPDAPTVPWGARETAKYSVLWSRTDLENTEHTVKATFGNFIVVDAFIYTELDETAALPPPTSTSSDPPSTPTPSQPPTSPDTSSETSAAQSSPNGGSSSKPSASSGAGTSSFPSSSSSPPSSLSLGGSKSLDSLSPSAPLSESSGGASTILSKHNNGLTIGLATAFAIVALIAALLGLAFCRRRRRLRAQSAGEHGSAQSAYSAVSTSPVTIPDSASPFLPRPYPYSSGSSDPSSPDDIRNPFSDSSKGARLVEPQSAVVPAAGDASADPSSTAPSPAPPSLPPPSLVGGESFSGFGSARMSSPPPYSERH
ncbi:hypothetical protein MVEN_02219300 [Mycena venus]|uniref:Mid2 domain-containing protein n=1 Tax=Mycena venus TaxID=2733690 RepID=A0A8H6X7X6_9AGAR|nr:hypothetical protein MVEN_02219300 [Mycena venus]